MFGWIAGLAVAGLTLAAAPAVGAQGLPTMVGQEWIYQVRAEDTLSRIAGRHNLSPRVVRGLNGLKPGTRLKPGQSLRLSTRRIVPPAASAAIVINIPDLHLYHFRDGRLAGWYPVALGQPFDTKYEPDPKRWQTPTGSFKIAEKRENPVWRVPKSIQEEMAAEGKTVYERMPPGPENPLGKFWIGLSKWGYGIHGTIAPSSVGRYKTHGCVRMKPEHIDRVFGGVQVGQAVRIVYEPVMVLTRGDEVWLQVSPDSYRKVSDLRTLTRRKLQSAGLTGRVDLKRVDQVAKDRWGIAIRVDPQALPPLPPATPSAAPPERL